MINAGNLIARLDAALAYAGATATVRRYLSRSPRSVVEAIGVPIGWDVKSADDLAGNIDQSVINAIVSPTGISFLPLTKGDKIVMGAREYNIEVAKPKIIGTTIVRIDLALKG